MLVSKREEEILEFWDREKIFERSIEERSEEKPYVFYDGPPFATGLPHYGNLPSSFMKDAIPRYQTMKGFRVERVWGWDCHGLPIENIIEERLQLKSKRDIESYGVAAFNEKCRAAVLAYAEEWKKIIRRLGRWVDMDHAYKTMDSSYMESVWWVFCELWKKGLIYEGKKAMHICPRCVTPLSNFEVTQGYQEVTDISAIVKFKLTDAKEKIGVSGNVYVLAWTTTPWTLPGNVLLAANENISYRALQETTTGDTYVLAADRWSAYADKVGTSAFVQRAESIRGADLVGAYYEPLFPYFSKTENAFRIVAADFVNTGEGTGIVHIAPAFGEDDYMLGMREKIPLVQHVTSDGHFVDAVVDFAHAEVKPKNDPTAIDRAIVEFLKSKGSLFFQEPYVHSYPHCWRCDTPLLNYATSCWFVNVTALKDQLLKNNELIAWVPEHMKEGRFGMWLSGARDWAISRNRYWGTPLPVWKNAEGGVMVVGSIAQLEELSGKKVRDLHKHIIDDIVFEKDGLIYTRVSQVLDCWFESGSMPYGQLHYPFENKEKFEKGFPAQFIAEGQDQTRGWFYTLHVLATALTSGVHSSIPSCSTSMPAFTHVIVNGIVLAEDGKKMSKHLKNYPDILPIVEAYGADALRYYLLTSPVVHAENFNFSEKEVREVYNKYVNTLWNVCVFFQQFCENFEGEEEPRFPSSEYCLDRWILSRLAWCTNEVTGHLDRYMLEQAFRPLQDFASDLSQWYVRRSRDRFKGENAHERSACTETLRFVLWVVCRLMAPCTPFLSEMIYREIGSWSGKTGSVHLEAWPEQLGQRVRDEQLEKAMARTRTIVESAHALRAEHALKVRQPLSVLEYRGERLDDEFHTLIAEELNVKEVFWGIDVPSGQEWRSRGEVTLNIHLSPELHEEGMIRELVRAINAQRKVAGLTPKDVVELLYTAEDASLGKAINAHYTQLAKAVGARSVAPGSFESMQEVVVDGRTLMIGFRLV